MTRHDMSYWLTVKSKNQQSILEFEEQAAQEADIISEEFLVIDEDERTPDHLEYHIDDDFGTVEASSDDDDLIDFINKFTQTHPDIYAELKIIDETTKNNIHLVVWRNGAQIINRYGDEGNIDTGFDTPTFDYCVNICRTNPDKTGAELAELLTQIARMNSIDAVHHAVDAKCQHSIDGDCQLCSENNPCKGTREEQAECTYKQEG